MPLAPRLFLSRRGFLIASVAGVVSIPFLTGMRRWLSETPSPLLLTSMNDSRDASFIAAIDLQGRTRFTLPVGTRCHGVAIHPTLPHKAVVYSRRPGYLAYLVDFKEGEVLQEFSCGAGRYFYGHGTFSSDGGVLFSTENDFVGRRGVITVRDGTTMKSIGEIPSHGIGPHEISVTPDKKTLVVANGGVFEHPDSGGRVKLNVDDMDSSLAFIDAASGNLLGSSRLENRYLGLRHLAVSPDGMVAAAIQNEGPVETYTSLIAFQKPGQGLRLAEAPGQVMRDMNHFGLSVCIHQPSGITGLTCPKGDVVTFWDSAKAAYLATLRLRDASGLSLTDDNSSFVVTSGVGVVGRISVADIRVGGDITHSLKVVSDAKEKKWDNHLSAVVNV